MKPINERFKILFRNELDYKQKNIADLLSVGTTTVSRWINGEGNIGSEVQILVFQKVEKLNARWWFFGEGEIWSEVEKSAIPKDNSVAMEAVRTIYEIERTRNSELEREIWELKQMLTQKEERIDELEKEVGSNGGLVAAEN